MSNIVVDADALQNAKYTISIARKLGCSIFLLPEDITEVKNKVHYTLHATNTAVVAYGLNVQN